MEKKVKSINVRVSFREPSLLLEEVRPFVSRGQILSGVLNGTCGYDSVPIMTDTPVSESEPNIDYDPANDQRLDRFDAVEMGIEAIDDKTPTRLPSGEVEAKSEKKE